MSTISIWGSYDAPFGGLHLILWLYPMTYLAGLFGTLFNLDWNIVVRIFFYLPSIFLSIYSIQRLAKSFNFGDKGKFLMGLIYLFNTYFILLIDGGQLGVMLAYAMFPLAIESIVNLSFFRTTVTLSILAMFDPRFFLMAVFCGLLLTRFKLSTITKITPILLAVLLINFYWLYPLLKVGSSGITTFVSELKLTSLLNSIFLYQPHWPNNVFGKITYPSFLFLTIPLLFVLAIFIKPTKEKSYWSLIFLIFAFLVKGETDPFGSVYIYILNNFSFTSAFRDSTKFFAPLIVVYSFIVSRFYDDIKNKYLIWIIPIMFLTPLIPGLIYGNHNNLTGSSNVKDMLELKSKLKDESKFLRTIYIPSKPQLAYQTENNQAIDGRVLTDYLPFAADNYGSEDRFNFMLRDTYINYFRSLGIKNVVYLSENKSVKPIVANIENSMPEKYYIDKLAVVVGSPIGVEKLVPEYGVLFLEDGKTNIENLFRIPSDNLFFYLNRKSINDLVISGLKDNFIAPSSFENNSWARYTSDDYLTWKYQLLIRDIDTKDINYDSGIIMSTVKEETTTVKINLNSGTNYKIFIRGVAGKDSQGVYVNEVLYKIPNNNIFSWVEHDFKPEKETNEIIIENNGGFNVIGQVLVIEDEKYKEYYKETSQKLEKYKIYNLDSKLPESKISYDFKKGWLILNQSYHNLWKYGEKSPLAINSITNGFFVEENDFNNAVSFEGQKVLDLGVKITLASILVLIVSYFGYALYKKRH